MAEESRENRPQIGVGQEYKGGDGEGRPDGPAGGLQQEEGQEDSEDEIQFLQRVDQGIAGDHIFVIHKKVADGSEYEQDQNAIGPAKALPPIFLGDGEEEKNQDHGEEQMNGTVKEGFGGSEIPGVQVVHAHGDGDDGNDSLDHSGEAFSLEIRLFVLYQVLPSVHSLSLCLCILWAGRKKLPALLSILILGEVQNAPVSL